MHSFGNTAWHNFPSKLEYDNDNDDWVLPDEQHRQEFIHLMLDDGVTSDDIFGGMEIR